MSVFLGRDKDSIGQDIIEMDTSDRLSEYTSVFAILLDGASSVLIWLCLGAVHFTKQKDFTELFPNKCRCSVEPRLSDVM